MARYKAPAIQKEAPVVVSHKAVWTHGVGDLGPVHRVAVYSDGSTAVKTECGNWPSAHATPDELPENRCPVCFGISTTSKGASK